MIPILLLDLAGVLLVIGYVLLDRHQNRPIEPTGSDRAEPSVTPDVMPSLPVEPIIAQRPQEHDEPRRIRRPNRTPRRSPASEVSRSDEA
ncbi:MAG: hypothetical protein AAF531_00120 [Actinomycetota bacterium]